MKRIQYVNKFTRETSPTLEQWMESLSDPSDKQSVLEIYQAEIENEQIPGNPPLDSYTKMFERYFAENNIEIVVTTF